MNQLFTHSWGDLTFKVDCISEVDGEKRLNVAELSFYDDKVFEAVTVKIIFHQGEVGRKVIRGQWRS